MVRNMKFLLNPLAIYVITLFNIPHLKAETGQRVSSADNANIHCYRNEYASIVSIEKKDEVGYKFLIRKPTTSADTDCSSIQNGSDVVIGDSDAYSYMKLVKSFLLLDSGDSADDALVIYDVPAGKKLIDISYSVPRSCSPADGCGSNEFIIQKDGIILWTATAEKPAKRNCKNFTDFMSTTGSAAIETKSFFSFKTKKLKILGGKRCAIRQ